MERWKYQTTSTDPSQILWRSNMCSERNHYWYFSCYAAFATRTTKVSGGLVRWSITYTIYTLYIHYGMWQKCFAGLHAQFLKIMKIDQQNQSSKKRLYWFEQSYIIIIMIQIWYQIYWCWYIHNVAKLNWFEKNHQKSSIILVFQLMYFALKMLPNIGAIILLALSLLWQLLLL